MVVDRSKNTGYLPEGAGVFIVGRCCARETVHSVRANSFLSVGAVLGCSTTLAQVRAGLDMFRERSVRPPLLVYLVASIIVTMELGVGEG